MSITHDRESNAASQKRLMSRGYDLRGSGAVLFEAVKTRMLENTQFSEISPLMADLADVLNIRTTTVRP